MGDASFSASPMGVAFGDRRGAGPFFAFGGDYRPSALFAFLLIPSAAYRRQRQFTELWAIDIAFDVERDMVLLI